VLGTGGFLGAFPNRACRHEIPLLKEDANLMKKADTQPFRQYLK
jgi:hypothetical protein